MTASNFTRRDFLKTAGVGLASFALKGCAHSQVLNKTGDSADRPNIVFILTDDHSAAAMSCYGSKINKTPNMDRLARQGMLFKNCFCTNSICAPSRAAILTGKYCHVNGQRDNVRPFDGSQQTFPKLLHAAGYETALIGKWHLASDPTGFDYWNVVPGQGEYHNPDFIEMGQTKKYTGYATDIITDLSIDWIKNRGRQKPFCLLYHHKAPHRPWQPDDKHVKMYADADIPVPETFDDDYAARCAAATRQEMSIDDLTRTDVKIDPPAGLTGSALKKWKYQRYIKDYLRCIASVDDNLGRFTDFLDKSGLSKNTIVIYASDQGFYLGEHGWFDKRFMYEQSLRMPLIVRWPGHIKPGSASSDMVLNIDFASTLLDLAGAAIPPDIQGQSFRPILDGSGVPADWRTAAYYHYYEYPGEHMVMRHYGIRTGRYKLIHFYYDTDCWELYDLQNDPHELNNLYSDPGYADTVKHLKAELTALQTRYGDSDNLAQKILREDLTTSEYYKSKLQKLKH